MQKIFQKFKTAIKIIPLIWICVFFFGNACSKSGDNEDTDLILLSIVCYFGAYNVCPKVGSISPDAIAGLKLWLKADSIASRPDGTNTGIWLDDSGNAKDAVQGTTVNQPAYYSNQLNGNPGVRFDGLVDDLSSASFDVNKTTIFLVSRTSRICGGAVWSGNIIAKDGVGGGTRSFGIRYLCDGASVLSYITETYTDGTTSFPTSILNISSDTWYLGTYDYDGSFTRSYLGGSLAATSSLNPGNIWPSGQAIEIGNRGGIFLQGDIAEIIVYDSALSDTNRQGVECYLSKKYNLAVSQTCAP